MKRFFFLSVGAAALLAVVFTTTLTSAGPPPSVMRCSKGVDKYKDPGVASACKKNLEAAMNYMEGLVKRSTQLAKDMRIKKFKPACKNCHPMAKSAGAIKKVLKKGGNPFGPLAKVVPKSPYKILNIKPVRPIDILTEWSKWLHMNSKPLTCVREIKDPSLLSACKKNLEGAIKYKMQLQRATNKIAKAKGLKAKVACSDCHVNAITANAKKVEKEIKARVNPFSALKKVVAKSPFKTLGIKPVRPSDILREWAKWARANR